MLRKEDFEAIGFVGRTHGIAGELACKLSVEIGELYREEEHLFLMLEEEGLLIPYRVVGHRSKAGDIDLLRFDGINTKEAAEQLAHRAVWLSKDFIAEEELSEDPYEYTRYQGFTLLDADSQSIVGYIREVDDSTLNTLLYIEREDGEELILPIADELFVATDDDQRLLTLSIPRGLLDDSAEQV